MLLVLEALTMLGGAARRAELVAATSRSEVDSAVQHGLIRTVGHGAYTLDGADSAREAACRVNGVVCGLSAALHHGWGVKLPPDVPHIAVPRNRRLRSQPEGVLLRRVDYRPGEVVGGVTSADRTLADVLRHEPFDSALAVADSALRAGLTVPRLHSVARIATGPGSRQIRRVTGLATELAANPFESVLRAIALDVSGLRMEPQVPIYDSEFLGRPDLVDRELGIIAEADSFEWHGGRRGLRDDALRYNAFVVQGWLVLRFSWEEVMFAPERVASTLQQAVALRSRGSAS